MSHYQNHPAILISPPLNCRFRLLSSFAAPSFRFLFAKFIFSRSRNLSFGAINYDQWRCGVAHHYNAPDSRKRFEWHLPNIMAFQVGCLQAESYYVIAQFSHSSAGRKRFYMQHTCYADKLLEIFSDELRAIIRNNLFFFFQYFPLFEHSTPLTQTGKNSNSH